MFFINLDLVELYVDFFKYVANMLSLYIANFAHNSTPVQIISHDMHTKYLYTENHKLKKKKTNRLENGNNQKIPFWSFFTISFFKQLKEIYAIFVLLVALIFKDNLILLLYMAGSILQIRTLQSDLNKC